MIEPVPRTRSTLPTPADLAEVLTIAETAERLRVSTRTVRRMIADGRLPAVRPTARIVRVPAAAVARVASGESIAA